MRIPGIVGISDGIRGVEDEIVQTRHADSTVLITGEDGVGKSLVARLIHDRSTRAAGPFVAASCAKLREEVLECQLFGAEYGTARMPGCDGDGSWLEAANGGTLFIDGVDKIGTRAQSALLRFLDSGRQQRVPPDRRPDRRKPALDVRLMTATRRSLFDAVRDGRFLEDLYYRLNVVHIQIPALRERREDVPALMEHFLRFFADVHERAVPEPDVDAQAVLMAYSWPGNVAELRAVAEWLVLQGITVIDAAALPATVRRADPSVRDAPAPALRRSRPARYTSRAMRSRRATA